MSLVEIACELKDAQAMGQLRRLGVEIASADDAGRGDSRPAKRAKRLSQEKTARALERRHL